MSVLFVMPPGGAVQGFTEHIGIGFLRATLARSGVQSAQYLPPGGAGAADFARHLRRSRPRLIGFTVYESNLRACRALARVARAALPEAVLLAGGPNATFSPEETLELVGVDACLRGAGEGTIVPVAQAVLGAAAPRGRVADLLAAIPNLVIREQDQVLRTAPASLASFQREHFRHLDDLPSPWQAGLLTTPAAGLLTSRGCNQHCTYCSFAAISERKVAFHSVERVLEDLAAWRSHLLRLPRPPPSAPILDDAFTLAPERARAICEGIIRRRLQLPFHCETRVDRVDEGLLRSMRRAGFTAVSFGLESAVPRVLRAIGKVQAPDAPGDPSFEQEGAWLDRFRTVTRQARRAGLAVHVSVICGLPGETAADFRATLDFVGSLDVASYAHNVLAAMPGTPLHAGLDGAGMGAGRDPDTGAWVTRHAYRVRSVRPRRGASARREHVREALQVVDALCGRPGAVPPTAGAVGAVVLHGLAPDPAAAAWIGVVLAVGGAVVSIPDGVAGWPAWRAWARSLQEARVAQGLLALLAPVKGAAGAYRVLGTRRAHRLEISTRWPSGREGLAVGPSGLCRALLWVGSLPAARPPPTPAARRALPQIADGCRWWSGWPRCARPAVLHVRSDRAVAACWGGPVLGEVGTPLPALRSRASGLIRAAGLPPGGCPIAPSGGTYAQRSAMEAVEVASQALGLFEAAASGGRRVAPPDERAELESDRSPGDPHRETEDQPWPGSRPSPGSQPSRGSQARRRGR